MAIIAIAIPKKPKILFLAVKLSISMATIENVITNITSRLTELFLLKDILISFFIN